MTLAEELEHQLPPGTRLSFGELSLMRHPDGSFEARSDSGLDAVAPLREVSSVRELRELAKFDADGNYRPLKTAPGLVRGWTTRTASAEDFLKRLDAIYPALFATWVAFRRGEATSVPLRQTLNRQTGMYRFAGTITREMAVEIQRDLCGAGCLRQVAWPVEDGESASEIRSHSGELPLICTEACTFAVSRARELSKAAHEARSATQTES